MMGGIAFNDRQYEVLLFRFRAFIAAFVAIIVLLVLMVRMLNLQVSQHEVFSTLSQNNRLQQVAVAPTRGLIYDRSGKILAENRPAYHLEITPERVADLDKTLSDLVEVINVRPSDIQRFQQALKRERQFEAIPLRVNLSEFEVAHFSVNRHRFPGVDITARLSRYYPYAESTAHLLGYLGRIDEADLQSLDKSNYRGTNYIGKLGLEREYEGKLHGDVGYRRIEVNVKGRQLRELEKQSPMPGLDLHLNLDIDLQLVAQRALGENSGAVVAINPNDGAVLALVSQPSYNPHLFVQGISHEEYKALQRDPGRPLFDRALRGQYPPGSTVKPVLGLAALAHGVKEQVVRCRGYYRLPTDKRKYRDWKKQGHGKTDLKKAIVESCDVFFYDLAYNMGVDAMAKYLAYFGLGFPTGIDLPGESRGLLPNREWKRKRYSMPWFPGETLIAGIGQGYMLMTPLQLAQMAAGLATGKLYRPRLLSHATQDDAINFQSSPELIGRVPISNPEYWEQIRGAMTDVVHGKHGTARGSAYRVKYQFAGKTGTAQVIGIAQDEEYDEEKIAKKHQDHALFIAYAPITKPQIALAVLVENGGHGGAVAAPIARKVFDEFMRQTNAGK